MESIYQVGSIVRVIFPLYEDHEVFEVLGVQAISESGEVADGIEIPIAGYQYFINETCFAEKFLTP